MRLYYIGNGFDLKHRMKTSYLDFKSYLKENERHLYYRFIDMYRILDYEDMANTDDPYISYEVDGTEEDIFWSEFENNLAYISMDYIQDIVSLNESEFDIGKQYDPEWRKDELRKKLELYSELQSAFQNWADLIDRQEVNEKFSKPIDFFRYDKKCTSHKHDGEGTDYFIVFNYTHTLENVYKILPEYIFRPHGAAGGKELEPQFGHGNIGKIREIDELLDNVSDEYKKTAYEWAKAYLQKMKKDVNFFVEDVEEFLKYNNVHPDKICIIGMSMGEVDIPYLAKANKLYPDVEWIVSYHKNKKGKDERKKFRNILLGLGIARNKIRFKQI